MSDRYVDYKLRKLVDGPFAGHVAKLIKTPKICYFVRYPVSDGPFAITGHEYVLTDNNVYQSTGQIKDCLNDNICLVRDYDDPKRANPCTLWP